MLDLGISDLLAQYSSRKITVSEYVSAALQQADRMSELGAFISIDREAVTRWARECDDAYANDQNGALCGLPLAVKDNIDFFGMPTTAGTPALRRHFPKNTAPVLKRLLDLGCGVLGKANLHELACGATTRNETFGYARTPYDSARVAGGSSGGTATALAARIVPAGLGTDTGASVRAPSAFCGTAALRPTVGPNSTDRRYPVGGTVPISTTRDTIGPMARRVADVALLDAAIMGKPVARPISLKGIKLALPIDPFWSDLDPQVEAVVWEMVRNLESRGVQFAETHLLIDANTLNEAASIADLWEFRNAFPQYLADSGSQLGWDDVLASVAGPEVRAMMGVAASVSKAQCDDALKVARKKLIAAYRGVYASGEFDGCLIPCTPNLPPLADDNSGNLSVELGAKRLDEFGRTIRNLYASAGAGVPGVAFPAGLTNNGLPVGVELGGPHGSDDRLLSVAMAIELELGQLPAPKLTGISNDA